MQEPRFKPGDFVVCRAQVEVVRLYPPSKTWEPFSKYRPLVWQIQEVVIQICPGGRQVSYLCRGASHEGVDGECRRFNDIELTPAPTEPQPVKE